MKNNFQWSFTQLEKKQKIPKRWMCHYSGGEHRSVARRRDMKGREQGWTTLGTRTDHSTIVRFHLLSASQEYTQKKENEKYLHGRGLEDEGWSFPFECLHFTYALFQRLLSHLEQKRNLKSTICSGIHNVVCQFCKTIIIFKALEAS